MEQDCVELFGGIIMCNIIHIINHCHELVVGDGVDNNVCIPHIAFSKVGSSSCFVCRSVEGGLRG